MTRGVALAIAVVIALVCGARPARADISDADAKASARRVLIALRVLAYDKDLATRHPHEVVTVAIASTASTAGRAERALWLAGFALLPKVKVGGRPVRAVAIELGDAKAIAKQVAQLQPAALIVTSEVDASLAAVRDASRAARALTLTRRESAVTAGLAVGLVAGAERDEIVINVESARAEGVRFGAGLLQLARLVESAP